jgi:hypothetical protein
LEPITTKTIKNIIFFGLDDNGKTNFITRALKRESSNYHVETTGTLNHEIKYISICLICTLNFENFIIKSALLRNIRQALRKF